MSHIDVSNHNSNQVETKKRKLLSEYNETVKKKANLELKMDTTVQPKLFPVIGDEYYKPVETEKMFVGKIVSKKETSRLIKELSTIFPFEGSHLKRVRWTKEKDVFEILLRPLHANETVEASNSFPLSFVLGDVCMNTTGLVDTAVLMDIPKNAALTYKQFQESSHFWPLQFRENKHIEKVLKDQFFTDNEKTSIATFMKMCISAANYGDEKVGCVVVDPTTSHVIAISHDQRLHHPLQHAVMVAADLVAKSQGGGSWNIKSEHMYHQPFSQEKTDEKINKLKELYPERDAKKMCLPYLCTGYDLYVSREPCVMCAMALVHSRIRRVFYASSTPWGAVGSHWKLHLQSSLNHHYDVWKVSLEDENILEENGVKSNVQSFAPC